MRNQPVLRFKLSGGLGNQLFQYSAGQYIALKRNIQVDYEIDFQGKFHKDSDIKTILGSDQEIIIPSRMTRSIFQVLRTHRFLARKIGAYRVLSELFSLGYYSPVVGYDPKLEKCSRSNSVYGYFQSEIYAETIRNELKNGIQDTPKPEKLSSLLRLSQLKKPVMVHIRRGDYLNHRSSIGVLDFQYFEKAIGLALSGNLSRQIWIFTDNKEQALKLISQGTFRPNLIVSEADELEPHQIIELMSTGRDIVVSNSTFSWWAAFLSDSDASIYYPSQWYRDVESPSNLIPLNWRPVQSYWEA